MLIRRRRGLLTGEDCNSSTVRLFRGTLLPPLLVLLCLGPAGREAAAAAAACPACTPKGRVVPDVVIPFWEPDLCKVAYTARSLAIHDPHKALGHVFFMWISKRPSWDVIGQISAINQSLAGNHPVTFVDFSKQVIEAEAGGWFAQQVLKLKIASLVTSDYYMVMDAKNTLIRDVGPETFFSPCHQAKIFGEYQHDDIPKPHADWYRASARVLNISEPVDGYWPTSITPMLIHTQTVLQMLDEIGESKALDKICAGPLCDMFGVHSTDGFWATEFTMYVLWAHASSDFECIHFVQEPLVPPQPIAVSLWRGMPERQQEQVLSNLEVSRSVATKERRPVMFGAQASALTGMTIAQRGKQVDYMIKIYEDAKVLDPIDTVTSLVDCVVGGVQGDEALNPLQNPAPAPPDDDGNGDDREPDGGPVAESGGDDSDGALETDNGGNEPGGGSDASSDGGEEPDNAGSDGGQGPDGSAPNAENDGNNPDGTGSDAGSSDQEPDSAGPDTADADQEPGGEEPGPAAEAEEGPATTAAASPSGAEAPPEHGAAAPAASTTLEATTRGKLTLRPPRMPPTLKEILLEGDREEGKGRGGDGDGLPISTEAAASSASTTGEEAVPDASAGDSSCARYGCVDFAPANACQCDGNCLLRQDCCEDATSRCKLGHPQPAAQGNGAPSGPLGSRSCARLGCGPYSPSAPCQCDDACALREDCCEDSLDECQVAAAAAGAGAGGAAGGGGAEDEEALAAALAAEGSLESRASTPSCALYGCKSRSRANLCQCDDTCTLRQDCCDDFADQCEAAEMVMQVSIDEAASARPAPRAAAAGGLAAAATAFAAAAAAGGVALWARWRQPSRAAGAGFEQRGIAPPYARVPAPPPPRAGAPAASQPFLGDQVSVCLGDEL